MIVMFSWKHSKMVPHTPLRAHHLVFCHTAYNIWIARNRYRFEDELPCYRTVLRNALLPTNEERNLPSQISPSQPADGDSRYAIAILLTTPFMFPGIPCSLVWLKFNFDSRLHGHIAGAGCPADFCLPLLHRFHGWVERSMGGFKLVMQHFQATRIWKDADSSTVKLTLHWNNVQVL